jgi:hypothetical protein
VHDGNVDPYRCPEVLSSNDGSFLQDIGGDHTIVAVLLDDGIPEK